jgi:hypothetical protein
MNRKAPAESAGAFLEGKIRAYLFAEELQDTHSQGEDTQNGAAVWNRNEVGESKHNHEDGKEKLAQFFRDFHE